MGPTGTPGPAWSWAPPPWGSGNMIAYVLPVAILSAMVAYAAVTAYGRRFDPYVLVDRLRPHLKALRGLARRPRRPRLRPDPPPVSRPPVQSASPPPAPPV